MTCSKPSMIIAATLFAAGAAFAQAPGPGGPPPKGQGPGGGAKLRAACGEDLQRLCADVRPGGGRLLQCLSTHQAELSNECTAFLQQAQAQRRPRGAPKQPPGDQPPDETTPRQK